MPCRKPRASSLWQRLISQFKSALIYILLFALALDLVLWLHEGAKAVPYEAIAIALILILNAGLGAYQEGKAEEALARLKALAMPSVWVMRDGDAGADPRRANSFLEISPASRPETASRPTGCWQQAMV